VEDMPEETEILDVVAVEVEAVETTVPFRIYTDSLLPAPKTLIRKLRCTFKDIYIPQYSPPFPAQAILH
jgi:hypothetical protein